MIRKTIEYTDYNGTERKEDYYFHITEAEAAEMEMSETGGFTEKINRIVQAQDMPEIIKIFKDLILKSYGVKSADGKQFIKINDAGVPLSIAFSQTEAYSKLFMELATDAEKAAAFVNGIIPGSDEAKKEVMKQLSDTQN